MADRKIPEAATGQGDMTRLQAAQTLVYEYVKARLEKTDTHVTFSLDNVYIVWFCKTLQNWKALLSTTLPDAMYYEVTFDGDRALAYLDAYRKWDNVCIILGEDAPSSDLIAR